MRKIILATMIVLTAIGAASAETKKKQTTKDIVTKQATSQIPATKIAELAAKKKAELNGTEWAIQTKPMGGGRGKTETDLISFSEDKVISKNLATLGYAATNFTVRTEEDGTVIWETMQTSEKDGIAFWRGDINDGVMRGVLSKRDKKDNAFDFSFVSASSTSAPKVEVVQ